jgi:hypothetical protein
LEGKFTNDGKSLSNQLVGILFKYLLDLCSAGHPEPCGIVYNQLEFVFAKFNRNGYLEDCIRCEWATEGSKSLLRTRLRDDTLNCASQALPRGIMSLLNLYGASLSWNSFSGNGASGYVFNIMVERNGTQFAVEKAMKVVVCSAEDEVLLTVFEANFRAMQSLDNEHTRHLVVVPDEDSLKSVAVGGKFVSSYLMSEIGTPLQHPIGPENMRRLLLQLYEFHKSANIPHGDARVPNVLRVNRTLKWIDMRYCPFPLNRNENERLFDVS